MRFFFAKRRTKGSPSQRRVLRRVAQLFQIELYGISRRHALELEAVEIAVPAPDTRGAAEELARSILMARKVNYDRVADVEIGVNERPDPTLTEVASDTSKRCSCRRTDGDRLGEGRP